MINDDTYKEMLKELRDKNKEDSIHILLERKFIKDKEEIEEMDGFRRSLPHQAPRSTDPQERRRAQLTRNVNDITREKISQTNQQKYLDAINKKNK